MTFKVAYLLWSYQIVYTITREEDIDKDLVTWRLDCGLYIFR